MHISLGHTRSDSHTRTLVHRRQRRRVRDGERPRDRALLRRVEATRPRILYIAATHLIKCQLTQKMAASAVVFILCRRLRSPIFERRVYDKNMLQTFCLLRCAASTSHVEASDARANFHRHIQTAARRIISHLSRERRRVARRRRRRCYSCARARDRKKGRKKNLRHIKRISFFFFLLFGCARETSLSAATPAARRRWPQMTHRRLRSSPTPRAAQNAKNKRRQSATDVAVGVQLAQLHADCAPIFPTLHQPCSPARRCDATMRTSVIAGARVFSLNVRAAHPRPRRVEC